MVSAMKHFSNASPLGRALGLQTPRGLAAAFSMARCATASLGLQIKFYTHDSLLPSHPSTRESYGFQRVNSRSERQWWVEGEGEEGRERESWGEGEWYGSIGKKLD